MKFTIKNLAFRTVSDFPAEVFTKLHDAVTWNEEGNIKKLREEFEELGSGACGTVFKLAEGYALKVNFTGYCSWDSDELQDGVILEALQGVPLVPTLYTYEHNNKYMLIQLIDGITVKDAGRGELPSLGLKTFDSQGFMDKAEAFYEQCMERGYYPKDLHNENVMVDRSGAVWVVDVGLFFKASSDKYRGRKEVHGHIEYLSREITGGGQAQKPVPVKINSPSFTLGGCTCSACMADLERSLDKPLFIDINPAGYIPRPAPLKPNKIIAGKKAEAPVRGFNMGCDLGVW